MYDWVQRDDNAGDAIAMIMSSNVMKTTEQMQIVLSGGSDINAYYSVMLCAV